MSDKIVAYKISLDTMSSTACERCGHVPGSRLTHYPPAPSETLNSYTTYSPAQRHGFASVLSEITMDVSRIDDEMKTVQAYLDQLQDERRALAKALDDQQCLLAPIRNVPDELLSEILFISIHDPFSTPEEFYGAFKATTSVCKRWRTLVISTKTIWSRIRVDDECTPPIETIQTWLTRSGDIPIQLDIYWYEDYDEERREAILDVLIQACSRWEQLSLTLQLPQLEKLDTIIEPMPILRRLVLDCPGGLELLSALSESAPLRTFAAAPALEEVEISSDPHLCLIPWPQLTAYTLHYSSVRGCLWSMKQCLDLVTCLIVAGHELDAVEDFPPVSPGPRTYPRLESWTVRVARPAFFAELLDHVTAPNLEGLVLNLPAYRADPSEVVASIPIIPFLTRSSCQLTWLWLQGSVLSASDLIDVLRHLPSLTDLAASQSDNGESPPIFNKELFEGLTASHTGAKTSLLGSPLLVPRLEELALEGLMNVDDEVLLRMISSRIGPPGEVGEDYAVTQLEKVNLRIWRENDQPELGTDLNRQLSIWEEEGNCILINIVRP